MKYIAQGTPTVVFGGEEYGTGLVARLGGEGHAAARREGRRRAQLRAHPPLQPRRHGRAAAAVQGHATPRRRSASRATRRSTSIGVEGGIKPQMDVTLVIHREDGTTKEVPVLLRIDTPIEVDYYLHGGILPYVLRELVRRRRRRSTNLGVRPQRHRCPVQEPPPGGFFSALCCTGIKQKYNIWDCIAANTGVQSCHDLPRPLARRPDRRAPRARRRRARRPHHRAEPRRPFPRVALAGAPGAGPAVRDASRSSASPTGATSSRSAPRPPRASRSPPRPARTTTRSTTASPRIA